MLMGAGAGAGAGVRGSAAEGSRPQRIEGGDAHGTWERSAVLYTIGKWVGPFVSEMLGPER